MDRVSEKGRIDEGEGALMDNLILIPARGGSTRIQGKNLRILGSKPLVGHVIAAAKDSGLGRVVVSTNSQEIAETAKALGAQVPFLRPEGLSGPHASSLWCILHALQWFQEHEHWTPEVVAFCPPSNPFIKAETIRTMCQSLRKNKNVNSIVTIVKPATHPFAIVKKGEHNKLQIGCISIEGKTIRDVERSQDWPEVWQGSPACRMTKSSFFFSLLGGHKNLTTISYGKTYDIDNCMGHEIGPIEAFDIDEEWDYLLAQQILKTTAGNDRKIGARP